MTAKDCSGNQLAKGDTVLIRATVTDAFTVGQNNNIYVSLLIDTGSAARPVVSMPAAMVQRLDPPEVEAAGPPSSTDYLEEIRWPLGKLDG